MSGIGGGRGEKEEPLGRIMDLVAEFALLSNESTH